MTAPIESADLASPPGRFLSRLVSAIAAIMRQQDTPERIARGMSLGIFVGLLPIMGIQMTVVAILALPLRSNLKAAVASVWISNPLTFIPMYWGYYKLGLLFYPSKMISWADFVKTVSLAGDWSWSNISESISRIMAIGGDVLVPMWTGAAILATLFAPPTYFVTRAMVSAYRERKARASI